MRGSNVLKKPSCLRGGATKHENGRSFRRVTPAKAGAESRSFFRGKAVVWPAAFLCILAVGSAAASFGGYQPAGAFTDGYAGIRGTDTVPKILSVLASRNSGGKVLGKAAEKLAAMNDRDLGLIATLCDRISADRGSAGADIAFSLITAMIVLS